MSYYYLPEAVKTWKQKNAGQDPASQVMAIGCGGENEVFKWLLETKQFDPRKRSNFEKCHDILLTAANDGNVEMFSLLLRYGMPFKKLSREWVEQCLCYAVEYEHINVLEWLAIQKLVTKELCCIANMYFMRLAVCRGCADVLRWLTKQGVITPEKCRVDKSYALKKAADEGFLEVLRWIASQGAATPIDCRVDNDSPLKNAAGGGHQVVVEWLLRRISQIPGICIATVCKEIVGEVLCRVAMNGRTAGLDLIVQHGEVVQTDYEHVLPEVVRRAVVGSHVYVLNWVANRGKLPPEVFSQSMNYPLRVAAGQGRPDVLDWLEEKGEATVAHCRKFGLLDRASEKNKTPTIEWLALRLPLSDFVACRRTCDWHRMLGKRRQLMCAKVLCLILAERRNRCRPRLFPELWDLIVEEY
jgi:hypothetical protein